MTETERRQGAGPVAVGFGRLSVPLSCPGALQANQSPQYVLAHPYLVNPWISDRFGGFPGLTRRIVRRCVTVMTSLCSSNSSAELVPFSVWAEPRTAGGYGTLRLAIQTAESPPSPADSHWISVFSSESCTARGPGGVWKRTAPRPPWSRLAGRAGNASSETRYRAIPQRRAWREMVVALGPWPRGRGSRRSEPGDPAARMGQRSTTADAPPSPARV